MECNVLMDNIQGAILAYACINVHSSLTAVRQLGSGCLYVHRIHVQSQTANATSPFQAHFRLDKCSTGRNPTGKEVQTNHVMRGTASWGFGFCSYTEVWSQKEETQKLIMSWGADFMYVNCHI